MFIIGARINSKWQASRSFADLAGRRGMNHMLKYLTEHPEGLLGYETMGFVNVQYWRSFEHLEAFAKTPTLAVLDPGRTQHSPSSGRGEQPVGSLCGAQQDIGECAVAVGEAVANGAAA